MQLFHFNNTPEGELESSPPDRNRSKADEKDKGETENGDEEPQPFASSLQVISALEEAFKKDKYLLVRLQGQALKLIRFYFRKNMLHQLTAKDVVDHVIDLLVSLKRKWYRDKVPDIVKLLFLVLHSFIRNEKKKEAHLEISIDLYNKDGELIETDISDLQRAYLREDFDNKEFSSEIENDILKLTKELESDTIAYFVLEEYLDIDHNEIKDPEAFVAAKLQITELDVKNAVRRIRRRIRKLKEKK